VDSSSTPVLSEMLLQECCPPLVSSRMGEILVAEEHPDPVNKEINENEAADDMSMKYVPPSWISTPLELHDCAATEAASVKRTDPLKNIIASGVFPLRGIHPAFYVPESNDILAYSTLVQQFGELITNSSFSV
jgi:hypothetical protein